MLDAAGIEGASGSENNLFPQLEQLQLQLQRDDGDVIEEQRERLPPPQQGNSGLPPLKREARQAMERAGFWGCRGVLKRMSGLRG